MDLIVIKTLNRCNSNCAYCFIEKDEPLNKVTQSVVEKLFLQLAEHLEADPGHRVELQWHGGEPLLMGEAFYRDAVDLQDRIVGRFKNRIRHSMQSNLTLLNESFLRTLMELGVASIGTSIDPVPGIRGIGKSIDSALYLKKFIQGLSLVKTSTIRIGINYVVTTRSVNIPETIFAYLDNLMPGAPVVFNPVNVTSDDAASLSIRPQQYINFLKEIALLSHTGQDPLKSIEPVHSMQRVAQELLSNKISENGSGEIPLVIDGTGAFFHYKSPGEPIGDLLHDTLGEMILKNSRINESTYERVKKERGCVQCQLDPYCRGNTVNDSFSQNEDFHHLDWCRARKDFVLGILMNQTMKRNEEY